MHPDSPSADSRPTVDLKAAPPALIELFIAFAKMSLAGFGGVLVWARRAIVDQHKWMTPDEFNEAFALCHFLPGPNIVNLSMVFGSRFRGLPGGIAAFLGLLGPPMILVTMLSWLVTYPAERAIFNSAPMPPPVPFFSPLAYLWFKFRFYSLFILFPATLAASQQSLSRFFPAFAEHPLTAALGIIGILGLFVFMPLAVPYVFGWVRMRDDAVRERLEQLAKRARFRFRELYVWPTRGSVANARIQTQASRSSRPTSRWRAPES